MLVMMMRMVMAVMMMRMVMIADSDDADDDADGDDAAVPRPSTPGHNWGPVHDAPSPKTPFQGHKDPQTPPRAAQIML